MKKAFLFILAVIISCSMAVAQEEGEEVQQERKQVSRVNDYQMRTLFGKQRSNGGYGAVWMGYTVLDNKHALQFGGRGSWVIQHSFALGFGGTGFINEYHYDAILDRDVFLAGGYGGIYLEPIILPRFPVHIAFPTLLGVGGISFVSYDDVTYGSNFVEDYEAFLIIEPSAEVEMNLTRFMRVGIGASYRIPAAFSIGQSSGGSADAATLRGLSYNISFKFGAF